jgi:hypothetical protein
MATSKIKSTYSLDPDTVRALEETARRWGVPKSEALRRAIRSAAAEAAGEPRDALAALDALQRAAALSGPATEAWAKRSRVERRAASARVGRRRG